MAASHSPRTEAGASPHLNADAWSWLAGFAGVAIALAAYYWLPAPVAQTVPAPAQFLAPAAANVVLPSASAAAASAKP